MDEFSRRMNEDATEMFEMMDRIEMRMITASPLAKTSENFTLPLH